MRTSSSVGLSFIAGSIVATFFAAGAVLLQAMNNEAMPGAVALIVLAGLAVGYVVFRKMEDASLADDKRRDAIEGERLAHLFGNPGSVRIADAEFEPVSSEHNTAIVAAPRAPRSRRTGSVTSMVAVRAHAVPTPMVRYRCKG